MTSVRLDSALKDRLKRASVKSGKPASQLMREALDEKCNTILGTSLLDQMDGIAGIICSEGGRAENTGSAFKELLQEQKERSN